LFGCEVGVGGFEEREATTDFDNHFDAWQADIGPALQKRQSSQHQRPLSVLEIPPLDSPETAVKVAIAAKVKN
jgi:hypothetical protein